MRSENLDTDIKTLEKNKEKIEEDVEGVREAVKHAKEALFSYKVKEDKATVEGIRVKQEEVQGNRATERIRARAGTSCSSRSPVQPNHP